MTGSEPDDDEVARLLLALPGTALDTLRDSGMLHEDGIYRLLEVAGRLARTSLPDAARLLDVVEGCAEQAGAPAATAAGTYLRARLVLEEGRPEQALTLIDQAERCYTELGLGVRAMRTRLGRMHVLDDLGRHDEAVGLGQQLLASLPQHVCDPELGELRASALSNVGVGLGYLGHHHEALETYTAAETAWQHMDRPFEAAVARANQGVELLALGQAAAAADVLSAAAVEFRSAGDDFWHAKCLGHHGEALALMGRFVAALDDLERARAVLLGMDAGTETWRLAMESARTLMALGMNAEAATLLEEVGPHLLEAGLVHDHATRLWLHGVCHLRLLRPAEAESALQESVSRYKQVGDDTGQARALIELSRCCRGGEATPVALDLLAEAALLTQQGPATDIRCALHLRRAELLGDDTLARHELEQARELMAELQLPALSQAVLCSWGLLLQREGDRDGAIDAFEAAAALAEDVGAQLGRAAHQAAFATDQRPAFDLAITALLARGSVADLVAAARLSDALKGSGLSDVSRGVRSGHPQAHADGPAAASVELDDLYRELLVPERPVPTEVTERIVVLERAIEVEQALRPGSATVIAPSERSRSVDPTPTVAYHLLGDEVLAFVTVAGTTRALRHLADRRDVLRLITDLESHIGGHVAATAQRHAHQRRTAFVKTLQQLYLAIFAAVADTLPLPTDQARSLVVVPHGPLNRIPFHALHNGQVHLVTDWAITVSPSLASARAASERAVRAGHTLVVGCSDARTERVAHEAVAVAAIADPAHVVLLRDDQATVDEVGRGLDGASLVHLASHGLFRRRNAAFSSIRLADGWLRSADVAGHDLRGATVILSACETGRVGDDGHRALGLAQGFLAAGARSVVVSQWLVDDISTEQLMVRLHGHLGSRPDAATALRKAQLETQQHDPDPYHWAPFMAVGAPASGELAS